MKFHNTLTFAHSMDESDTLKRFRDQFLFPKSAVGDDILYFAGNSLGLQPKRAREYINEELTRGHATASRGISSESTRGFPITRTSPR